MSIIEPVIRPPAEASSFLLQVTLGCSVNFCTFCGAYKNKPFAVKSSSEITADIKQHARWNKDTRRVFLIDGDALVLGNDKLIPILKETGEAFPKLSRISSYTNGHNITQRSDSELKELKDNKLSLIYIGLESGSQDILDYCHKRSTAKEMIEAVNKAAEAGIKSSVIVLLGLGGQKHSEEHIRDTIEALNLMQPRYLSFLSLMVIPGTGLAKEVEKGSFKELTPLELLKESYEIIKGVKLNKTIFRSNHASNHLPLEGTFPKDKIKLLNTLEAGISGELRLKPEFLRGL
ncbi:MAG: radical SAM protein [Candidatus Omnitrophica bacterium]|nr:radical SAM protein [Candidatus Omnitrophota bacterium]